MTEIRRMVLGMVASVVLSIVVISMIMHMHNRHIDVLEKDVVILNDGWQAYWGQHLTPPDFREGSVDVTQMTVVPTLSSWNEHALLQRAGDQILPSTRMATYRKQIMVPPQLVGKNISFSFISLGTTYQVWVNGRLAGGLSMPVNVAESTADTSVTENIRLNVINVFAEQSTVDIIVYVPDNVFRESGIYEDVFMSDTSVVYQYIFQKYLLQDVLTMGIVLVFGLHHLLTYLLNRQRIELLWISLLTIAMGLHQMFMNTLLAALLLPVLTASQSAHILYSFKFIAVAVFIQLIYQQFSAFINQWLYRIHTGIALLGVVYALNAHPDELVQTMIIQNVIIIMMLVYYMGVVGVHGTKIEHEHMYAGVVILCLSIFGTVYDTYADIYAINTVYAWPYVIFVNVIVQSISWGMYNEKARVKNILLAQELSKTNHQLEEKVLARTYELQQSYLQLEDMARGRTAMLANIAHDMGSPIQGMQLALQMLPDATSTKFNPQRFQQLFLSRIQYLQELANDLFRYVQLESGQQAFQWEVMSIQGLHDTLREHVANVFVTQQQYISFAPMSADIRQERSGVRVDRYQMMRVVQNLIENALTHSDDAEVYVTCESMLIDTVEGQMWNFSVRDTGLGIPADQLPLIFERLYTQSSGSGLGLAIVKQIVDSHNGIVSVTSQFGAGSVFTVMLPVVDLHVMSFD